MLQRICGMRKKTFGKDTGGRGIVRKQKPLVTEFNEFFGEK
jgi:hypothetical protein